MNESQARLMIQGGALLATLGAGLVIGSATSGSDASDPVPQVEARDAGVRRIDKRLDITTDAELSPGATVAASGAVEVGTRLVPINSCVGHYDAVTSICVLSPGPWELHSACYERSGADAQGVCEVTVRNAGRVPLKFAGYIEVAR